MAIQRALLLSSLVLLGLGCAKPAAPSEPPPASEPAPGAEPAPADPQPSPTRTPMTAAQCEAEGGKVVGDIGDGAIHQPGYTCPDSGEPPLGSITPEEGGPISVEGAVCCGATP